MQKCLLIGVSGRVNRTLAFQELCADTGGLDNERTMSDGMVAGLATLWEAPDNVSMAAVALAISGGGALSSLETTVLLTVDETLDALRKAQQVQYEAPGA